MKKKILWITRTAVMMALLVTLQWATSGLGQFVTGSCVNAVLVVATLAAGIWSGVTVALLSPFCAFLLGIGPKLIQIVPAIALGNVVLVLLAAWLLGGKALFWWGKALGIAASAAGKFLVLYLAVVQVLNVLLAPAGNGTHRRNSGCADRSGHPQSNQISNYKGNINEEVFCNPC